MSEATEVVELEKLKVIDLKKLLKERGLNISGNKAELIARLQAHEAAGENGAGDVADEDELLEGDEEEEVDEEVEEVKEDVEETEPEPVASPTEGKKIKLTGLTFTPVSKPTEVEVSGGEALASSGEPPSSEGSAAMRAKRAERFGIQSEEARKLARAQRFGVPYKSSTNGVQGKSGKLPQSTGAVSGDELEKLKKRAERFGTVIAPPLSKATVSEQLLKRKERFGISTKATSTEGSGASASQEEMKRRRLERFGPAK